MKKYLFVPAFFVSVLLNAQNIDDAFRYLQPLEGAGVSSKSFSFSNTTFGNDISGVFGNPASLGLLKRNQISTGFNFNSIGNESNFLSTKKSQDYSTSKFDHAALVIPFPVSQGSLVLGLGISKNTDFDGLSKGSAFNESSSYIEGISGYDTTAIIENLAVDSKNRSDADLYFDYAYNAYLIDPKEISAGKYKYKSASVGHSQQDYKNISEGDIYTYTAAFSVEIAPEVFIGGSLNFISGSYKNTFSWKETADLSYYYNHPENFVKFTDNNKVVSKSFHHLNFEEVYDDNIAGYSLKLGALAKLNDFVKIGGTIYFPSYLSVTSKYSYDLIGYFIDPNTSVISSHASDNGKYNDEITYELSGPMTVEGNIGVIYFPFQCEAGLITTSWTNTSFADNSQINLDSENEKFKFETKRTYNFKLGLQYSVPEINSNFKAGIHTYSGFKTTSNKTDYLYSLGLEFVPESDYSINFAYSFSDIKTAYSAYQPYNKPSVSYSEASFVSNFSVSAIFRF